MESIISCLNTYKGDVLVNGTPLANFDFKGVTSPLVIKLSPKGVKPLEMTNNDIIGVSNKVAPSDRADCIYKIQVRQYMTKPASPEFDFMAKYNNNVPMPLRVMVGKKIKETKGMVYMELHGDILEERTRHCMKCGRMITNPVSQFFGLGPDCGGHNYTNPFDSDEELKAAVEKYKLELRNLKWQGWIIKSAIESEVVIND